MNCPLLRPLAHLSAAGHLIAEPSARALNPSLGDALTYEAMLEGVKAQLGAMCPLAAISDRHFFLEISGHLCLVYPLGRRVSSGWAGFREIE